MRSALLLAAVLSLFSGACSARARSPDVHVKPGPGNDVEAGAKLGSAHFTIDNDGPARTARVNDLYFLAENPCAGKSATKRTRLTANEGDFSLRSGTNVVEIHFTPEVEVLEAACVQHGFAVELTVDASFRVRGWTPVRSSP